MIDATSDEFKIACIGPAGENLVRFACIMNDDGRTAGRSGVGAVMGSKNLKAIAARGTKAVTVADDDAFYRAIKSAYNTVDGPGAEELKALGTPGVMSVFHNFGCLATRNFQSGVNPHWEKLCGETLADTLSVRPRMGLACPGCPIGCGRVSRVSDPDFAGVGAGPEFETIGMFGSCCGVTDLNAVTKANFICNQMGMDTISAGNCVACTMELFEKGYISEADIGFSLNFGDAHAMVRLTEMIARREGFGDELAEGAHAEYVGRARPPGVLHGSQEAGVPEL